LSGSRAAYAIASLSASRPLQVATRFFERHSRQRPRRSGFGARSRPRSLHRDPLGGRRKSSPIQFLAVPYQLSFSAIGDDGVAKVSIAGILSDNDLRLLELYLEDADRLLRNRTAREGVPASLEIKVKAGQVVRVASEYPDADQLDALLHRLRPFVLQNEPASFDNACGAIVRCLPHPYIRGYVRELRRQYNGTDGQQVVSITSNDVVINCERTLQDWLNGFEYHRDLDKRERIQSLHRLMTLESSMPIFMDLLGEKVTAIFRLADLIAVVLGRQNDVKVQRRRRIDGIDP
jgi:hypothetical protein